MIFQSEISRRALDKYLEEEVERELRNQKLEN